MKYYGLKIQDEFLDLFDDQVITFTEENPLVDFDNILPNVKSFSILLPPSSRNVRLLGNHNDLQQFGLKKKIETELHLFGSFYCTGTLFISGVDDMKINCQFTEFDYLGQLTDNTLNSLDLPSFDLMIDKDDKEAPLPQFFTDLTLKNATYSGPVKGKDFVAPTIYNEAAIGVNEYTPEDAPDDFKISTPFQNLYLGAWDTAVKYESNLGWSYPIVAVSPMLFVSYITNNIFKLLKIIPDKNELENDGFHNLILYNNRAIVLFNKQVIDYNMLYSLTEPSYNKEKIRPYEDTLKLSEFNPSCSIINFLKSLSNTFNVYFDVNRSNNTISIRKRANRLKEIEVLNISDIAILDNKSSYQENQKIKQINPEDYYEEGINKKYNFIKSVNLLTDLPLLANDGDAYFVHSSGILYRFYASTSKFKPLNLKNVSPHINYSTALTEGKEIKTGSSPISNNQLLNSETSYGYREPFGFIQGVYSKTFAVPEVKESLMCNSTAYDKAASGTEQTSNIIFLLYRGMMDIGEGFSYPFASSTSNNPLYPLSGDNTYSNSLNMYGAGGIYETFWRGWIENFKVEREITLNIKPDAFAYKNLFNNKIQIGNQYYFAKSKTIKLSPNQIESCQAVLLQVKP